MTRKGLDISQWQHADPIDYRQVVDAGYSFVIVKIADGATGVNDYAEADINGFRDAGADVAGYLFIHPSEELGPQIKNAVEHAYGVKTIVVDSEVTEGMPWSAVAEQTHAALQGLSWELYNAGLYSNGNFLANMEGAPWGFFLDYADPSNTTPPLPATIIQTSWTDQVPGISGQVDEDEFVGSDAEYEQLFSPTPPPVDVAKEVDQAVKDLEVWKEGSHGDMVISIKSLLKTWGGFECSKGGGYDANTAQAVRAFQGQCGLTQDGIVGPNTWVKLLRGPAG